MKRQINRLLSPADRTRRFKKMQEVPPPTAFDITGHHGGTVATGLFALFRVRSGGTHSFLGFRGVRRLVKRRTRPPKPVKRHQSGKQTTAKSTTTTKKAATAKTTASATAKAAIGRKPARLVTARTQAATAKTTASTMGRGPARSVSARKLTQNSKAKPDAQPSATTTATVKSRGRSTKPDKVAAKAYRRPQVRDGTKAKVATKKGAPALEKRQASHRTPSIAGKGSNY